MALLWIPQDQPPHYAAALLGAETAYIVKAGTGRELQISRGTASDLSSPGTVMIRSSSLTGSNRVVWCLYCSTPGTVRVSSVPVLTTLSVLRHRDLVTMPGGSHFYFSTESLPQVVPFPGSSQEAVCPRDHQPIQENTPAVQCPRCHTWYHQTDDCPCYTYAETCASCKGHTTLEAAFEWVPERG
jgi:hypothetical protein